MCGLSAAILDDQFLFSSPSIVCWAYRISNLLLINSRYSLGPRTAFSVSLYFFLFFVFCLCYVMILFVSLCLCCFVFFLFVSVSLIPDSSQFVQYSGLLCVVSQGLYWMIILFVSSPSMVCWAYHISNPFLNKSDLFLG